MSMKNVHIQNCRNVENRSAVFKNSLKKVKTQIKKKFNVCLKMQKNYFETSKDVAKCYKILTHPLHSQIAT